MADKNLKKEDEILELLRLGVDFPDIREDLDVTLADIKRVKIRYQDELEAGEIKERVLSRTFEDYPKLTVEEMTTRLSAGVRRLGQYIAESEVYSPAVEKINRDLIMSLLKLLTDTKQINPVGDETFEIVLKRAYPGADEDSELDPLDELGDLGELDPILGNLES